MDEFHEYIKYEHSNGKLIWIKMPNLKTKIGTEVGRKCFDGYRDFRFRGKTYKTHRVIWFLVYGYWPKWEIDHINRIRDDNRIENLRDVPARLNAKNRSIPRDNPYIGCYFHKKNQNWVSQIRINGKNIHLGSFDTEIEAHEAYMNRRMALEIELINDVTSPQLP